ncbi:MAG: hypothetical protein HOP15_15475 [Planctomycetes bacterium]|nr:hypothetical protein [Planctomycetota bacterium]
MNCARARRRAGFTVLETVISMALIGLVLTKLTLVMDEARRAHQGESAAMQLEDQAMALIDRISYAIVGSARESLDPALLAPFPMAEIRFQVSLGVEDGKVVWSDPEKIGLEEETGQVYWGQNVGEPNERRVVWANTVSEMLEDELMNGVDDNGNELVNELGLAFVVDDKSVTIRLSLEREVEENKRIQVTKETTVTCRN